MVAPSFRIDVVCGELVELLEGARRTWLDRPAEAEAALSRLAEEHLERVLAEHAEVLGPDDPWGPVLRREVRDTFLPRYLRLAVDMNELEARGYRAWRRGDPVARIVATLGALVAAVAFVRLVHHPAAVVALGLVPLVPFVPEMRAAVFRRRYRRMLQGLVDDMTRIQEALEARGADALALPAPRADAEPRG